ncbi:hypothetical protein [Methylococcus sp. EFPC2]|uniref:hypothetical protein n=1 Tax=Methylococcus sp. EFPC2 TaxID=2812648 RepID=UPI001967549D|nr:hypothetical protein [Methylococcus sp. EFPC2]QSA98643.1 hypothetical protein JWZ97_07575 [Methylococcus sp. EFPC2]
MRIKSDRNDNATGSSATNGEQFPSARYFQVHFEYLENLLGETRACLDALKRQVATVHQGEGVDTAVVGSPSGAYSANSGQQVALRGSQRGRRTGNVKSS